MSDPAFCISLIARPGDLDRDLPDALRNAWGGGALRWLSPGEAAEFDVPTLPGNLGAVRADLRADGVDLLAQPALRRRKRLLLADMDSTMIEQECIDELADEAGFGAQVREITAKAMNGELEFEAALAARVALLKGLPVAVIDKVLDERITFASGGAVLLATMKAQRAHTALVSGGFTAFTEVIAGRLGFDEHRANKLLARDGRLTGEVAQPILGKAAKVETLQALTLTLGIGAEEVLAVGDGANDLGMLHLAGAGVAMHAKPAVAAQCDMSIHFGDLTALLYLQGYAREEFVAA